MDFFDAFAVDEDAEVNGVWVDFGEGMEFLIASTGTSEYRDIIARLMRPHRDQLAIDALPETVADELQCAAMAEGILRGWRTRTDSKSGPKYEDGTITFKGKPLRYSTEQAKKLLTDFREFRRRVRLVANSFETFKAKQDKDAEKNSPGASGGTSSGPTPSGKSSSASA